MNSAAAAFDGIDVLVSNAGIQRYGDVIGTSDAVWDEVMSVNLKGCFNAAKFAVPHMMKRASGAIVVVGSVQTFTAVGNSVAYVTAKHALLGLVRAMALDYAQSKNMTGVPERLIALETISQSVDAKSIDDRARTLGLAVREAVAPVKKGKHK